MARTKVLWVLVSVLAGGACSYERDEGLSGPVPASSGARPAGSSGDGGKGAARGGTAGSGGRSAGNAGISGGSSGGTLATGGRRATATSGSAAGGKADCQPRAARCDAVEPILRTCDDSGTWQTETCRFVCRAGACAGECEPGERRCDGLQPMRCSDLGRWLTDGQTCHVMCQRGACTGACNDGDQQCSSATTAQTCVDNLWGASTDCPFTCADGACGGECEPATTRCASDTEIETCGSSGTWNAASACDFVCREGLCTGECRPGDQRCGATARELETCGADGRWVAATCPEGGACSGDACVTCLAGATQCASTTSIETCGSNNEWGPPAPCPNACVDAKCTGDCTPGSRECTGGGKPSQRTCNDQGVFVTQPCDRGESCLDGTCDSFPKVIFVTSELFDGDLGGVSGADRKCRELAERAGISGDFLALVNEPGRTIFERFGGDGGPYQLTDGTVVATHFEELGNALEALDLTELGSAPRAPDLEELSEAGRAELVEECQEGRLKSLVWCNAPVTGVGQSVCSGFSESSGALGASFCDWSAPDWDRVCSVTASDDDEGYCKIRAPLVCIQR